MMEISVIGVLFLVALKLGVVRGTAQCQDDEIFCLDSGRCILKESDCTKGQHIVSGCPPDEVFCLQTGRCIKQEPPCHERETKFQCEEDEVFCLVSGKCIKKDINCNGVDETIEHCSLGQVKCLQTGKCIDIQDTVCKNSKHVMRTTCFDDEVFCIQRGQCVPKESVCQTEHKEVITVCQNGEVMCLQTGACIENAYSCDRSNEPFDHICDSGKIFCLMVGKCVDIENTCQETDQRDLEKVCDTGQVFCLNEGTCIDMIHTCDNTESRNPKKNSMCKTDEIFCLHSGECRKRKDVVDCNEDDDHSDGQICPVDEVFCLQTQQCVAKQQHCDESEEHEFHCSMDELFCLQSRKCIPIQPTCDSNGHRNGADNHCSDGEVFCLQHDKCVSITQTCINEGSRSRNGSCPDGFIKCLMAGKCVANNDLCESDQTNSNSQCEHEEMFCLQLGTCIKTLSLCSNATDALHNAETCSNNDVLCLQTGKCVSQSDVRCSDDGSHGVTSSTECTDGTTFCLQSGKCVSSSCDTGTIETTTVSTCGFGLVFCLKTGTCLPPSTCAEDSSIDDYEQCSTNDVFCLHSSKCVALITSSCMNNSTGTTMDSCKDDETFCLLSGNCVPNSCLNVTSYTENNQLNISTDTTTNGKVEPLSTEAPSIDIVHLLLPEALFIGEAYVFTAADVLMEYGITEINLNCSHNVKLQNLDQNPVNMLEMSPMRPLPLSQTQINAPPAFIGRVVLSVTSEGDAFCVAHTQDMPYRSFVFHIVIIPTSQVPTVTFAKDVQEVEEDTQFVYFIDWTNWYNMTLPDNLFDISGINVSNVNKENFTAEYRTKLMVAYQNRGLPISLRLASVPNNLYNVPVAILEVHVGSRWIPRMSIDINPAKDMYRIRFTETCSCQFLMELHQVHPNGSHLHDSMMFEMVPVNDAPVLTHRAKIRYSDIVESILQYPYVHTEIEFKVSDITDHLYTDADEHDIIGIAVIGQLSDKLGVWEYSNHNNWSSFPVIEVSDVTVKLNPTIYRLGPNRTIRFVPNNSSLLWSRHEAISYTKLLILAFDDSIETNVDHIIHEEIQLFHCSGGHFKLCGQGGTSEYSRDIVPLYISRVGCDGVPSSMMAADNCGICGGHNDCVDCTGVPHGGASFDMCGDCTGGVSGVPYGHRLDCNDECGMNYFEPKLDMCVRNGTDVHGLLSILSCDMVLNSGAYINRCGFCVMGNTLLPIDYGEDNCSVCHGDGTSCLDCDAVLNGNKQLDFCGHCLHPSDNSFNKGCNKLGSVSPHFLRNFGIHPVKIVGVKLDLFASVECSLSGHTDITLTLTSFDPVGGIIDAMTPQLDGLEGTYNLSCMFDMNTTLVIANAIIIYSYPTVIGSSQNGMTVGENVKINITLDDLVNTGYVKCVFLCPFTRPKIGCYSPYTISSINIPTTVLDNTAVHCDLQNFAHLKHAGSYNLSVIVEEQNIVEVNRLSIADFIMRAEAPTLLAAIFDRSYCFFSMIFSTEIYAPTQCIDVFELNTINLLGSNPTCMSVGRRIMVKPGDDHTLRPGDMVSIQPSSIYPFGSSPEFSDSAIGFANISSAKYVMYPKFTLVGPTVVGSCDAFNIILLEGNVGCFKLNYEWSIERTIDANGTEQSLNEIQDFINRINSISRKSLRMIHVHHNEIPPGYTVEFSVKVNDSFNERTYHLKHNVSREANLNPVSVSLLMLGNREEVDPAKIIRFHAKATIAVCYNTSNGNIRYSWQTGSSDYSLSDFNDLPIAAIRPDTLRGGEIYTITVNAFLEEDTTADASTFITFHTVSKPLEVVINGGKNIMFSQHQDVLLDAGTSRDPDRTHLPPFFTWTCSYDNGFPCFIRSGNGTILMSSIYTTNERVLIPANTLDVGERFSWTVTMTVGARSGTYTTMVEIVNVLPPSLDLPQKHIVVNPDDKLRIPCSVTSFGPVIMTWSSVTRDGYDFIDITDHLPSNSTVYESSVQIKNKDFSLFLDLSKETKIPAGAMFILAVSAYALDNGQSREDFVSVNINSPPTTGNIYISPSNGTSLHSDFIINIGNGWTDLDGDSTMLYFYVKESSSIWMRLNARGLSNIYTYNFMLTEGNYDVMVEICDSVGACANVKHMKAISVEPKIFTSTELDNTAALINEALKSDMNQAIGMAMAFSTLLTSSDNSNTSSISSVINDVTTSLLTSVVVSIDPADATSVLDSANSMLYRLSTSGAMGTNVIAESQSLAFDLSSYVTGTNDKSKRRRRRSSILTVTPISVNDAEIILTTYSFTFSSQQEESISTSSANDFLKALDNIFIGACATVSYAEDTTSIRSGLVTVNVDKRATENTATTIYDVSCSNCSEITYPANVVYGHSIESQFTQWNCSAYLSCYGACFASAQITMDLVTPISPAEKAMTNRMRRSDIVILRIVNPVDYRIADVSLLQHPVEIYIPVYKDTNTTEYSLQCLYWHVDTWTDSICTSAEPFLIDSGYTVRCSCSLLGYIAIFEGPPIIQETTTSEILSTDTETTSSSISTSTTTVITTSSAQTTVSVAIPSTADAAEIHFAIDADYSTVVGLYTNTFVSVAKESIATTMQINKKRIVDMKVRSGSIIVSFTVVKGNAMDTTVTTAVQYLHDAIMSDGLVITNKNGDSLPIIKSSFSYQVVEKDVPKNGGNMNILYIILGCIGGLLVVAVTIIGGLLHKMKKDNTTINNSPPPPYGPQMHGVDVPRPASTSSSKVMVQENPSRKKSRDGFIDNNMKATSFKAGHGSTKRDIDAAAMEKGNCQSSTYGSTEQAGIGAKWVEKETKQYCRTGSANSIPGPAEYMPQISG